MITVSADNKNISVNMIEFSDGAITFKLDSLPDNPRYIWIVADPSTPVYRVREEISLVRSCIENFYGESIADMEVFLGLEYLPYARADRVFEKGNPSPLYDFLVWLDRQRFSKIYVNDIHNSKVLEEYHVDNIVEKNQLQCFRESLPLGWRNDYDVIVAPDLGATLKAKTIADYLGVDCVYADKRRDVSTGRLINIDLPQYDFEDKVVLVPDDIADQAGTHVWLADLLRDAGVKRVDLYVTHAILPKGLQRLKESNIDKLIVYQTVGGYINKQNVSDFNK